MIWTNPNPGQAFAQQTISIDISDYDYIEIDWAYGEASGTSKGRVGEYLGIRYPNRITSSGVLQYLSRDVNMANPSTGISIGDCTAYTQGTAAGSVVNTRLIPWRIYGIKYH